MPAATQTRATVADLHRVHDNAELLAGSIVAIVPVGFLPSQGSRRIPLALADHSQTAGTGAASPPGAQSRFVVPELPSRRESCSPDAAYHTGPPPTHVIDFIRGPPTSAAEAHGQGDTDAAAKQDRAAQRAEDPEAGTLVVWDVDPANRMPRSYRRDAPDRPTSFGPAAIANAEPVGSG